MKLLLIGARAPSLGASIALSACFAALSPTVSVAGTRIAAEGQKFVVSGTQTVRFGAGPSWLSKSVSSEGACTVRFFGGDPAYGTAKTCELVSDDAAAGAASASSTSLMPTIDATKIPAAAVGYSTARVHAANVADPGNVPVPSDIGDFREVCDFSHMAYEDPIVSPGTASAHLHTFFGNTGTNRNSTADSLARTGNSTCAGGTLNRTGYWVPTMVDTKDGTPLKPQGVMVYYKQGYNYIASSAIHALPAGLRMLAGSAGSAAGQDGIANYNCNRTDGTITKSLSIPTDCPVGATLTQNVRFPQCWDGVNLDSPDHKSHMAYPNIGCPSTHPVAVPEITFQVYFTITGSEGTKNWRLSSDNYARSLPGGYSSHADWFGGWDSSIKATWTSACINASMDCHAYLIGDGRALY